MTPNVSILLVDDETKILAALAQALRDDGHEVVATACPREAQRLLAAADFDLVIVDNLMPELTGLDLIRELSATPAAERPQIIMMTAHATVESAIEAMKLGAFDYLQKPFEVDELLVVGQPRGRASAAAVRAPVSHQRARRRIQSLRHRRAQPADAGSDSYGGSGGEVEEHGARSPARPGPARRWWRARSTITARSARCRSSR